MYSRFLDIMRKAGIELDATDLADAVWLAQIAPDLTHSHSEVVADDDADDREPLASTGKDPIKDASAKVAEAHSQPMSVYDKKEAQVEGIPAAELLLPAVAPLSNPAAAAIGRALRPLARRRRSSRECLFDEEATASASGHTGVVTPIFRPASERWFSVAVVMEETASMAVWLELAGELELLFARHGGFNQTAQWRVRFSKENQWLVAPNGSLQPISLLHRLGERQLIILMTDGASAYWSDGRMAGVLQGWGRVCPVVILQVVPELMWRHTRLGIPTAVVRSHRLGSRNSDLSQWPRSGWVKLPKNAIAFSVVTLDPDLIAEWATMVMHPGIHFSAVPLVIANNTDKASPAQAEVKTPSATDRLAIFRRRASKDAYQLAIYLSFLPLTLPVMRTVQSAMLREHSPIVLSELMLGGLIRREDRGAPIEHPDKLRLEFHDGVRALLNTRIQLDEIPPLLHLVADYLSRLTGNCYTVSALMPYFNGDKLLSHQGALPFAKFLRQGLARLGLEHLYFPDEVKFRPEEGQSTVSRLLFPFTFTTVTLDATGKEMDRRTLTAREFIEELAPGVKLEMVEIPGGAFWMGSPEDEHGRDIDEGPQHHVEISPFYIGKYAITQEQWRTVADWPIVNREIESDPSQFKEDIHPVEKISWEDAQEFCARLSRKTGRHYRLPTEAEWEYTCRAGTATPFAFGETITTDIVNYDGNHPYANAKEGKYLGETIPVGSLGIANAFGIYDMHGNVLEWCQDWYNKSFYMECHKGGLVKNPQSLSGENKAIRGGSYFILAKHCRSASRSSYITPSLLNVNIGMRVVVSAMDS